MVNPYNTAETATDWKSSRLILSERSDFHMVDNQLIAVHALHMCMLTWLSLNEIFLPKYIKVKLATIVQGDLKDHFSIATTPKCGGRRHPIP